MNCTDFVKTGTVGTVEFKYISITDIEAYKIRNQSIIHETGTVVVI